MLVFCISLGSLAMNNLTNYGADMSSVITLAEALKENKGLTSLKYASSLQHVSFSAVSSR